MTNAQTEARAIARKLQDVIEGHSWRLNIDKATDIIATALAAKDAELAELRQELGETRLVLEQTERNAERIIKMRDAQLAEARKALEQRDTDITEFMGRLGSRWFLEQGWFPASVGAREDDARRARTGGKNG